MGSAEELLHHSHSVHQNSCKMSISDATILVPQMREDLPAAANSPVLQLTSLVQLWLASG